MSKTTEHAKPLGEDHIGLTFPLPTPISNAFQVGSLLACLLWQQPHMHCSCQPAAALLYTRQLARTCSLFNATETSMLHTCAATGHMVFLKPLRAVAAPAAAGSAGDPAASASRHLRHSCLKDPQPAQLLDNPHQHCLPAVGQQEPVAIIPWCTIRRCSGPGVHTMQPHMLQLAVPAAGAHRLRANRRLTGASAVATRLLSCRQRFVSLAAACRYLLWAAPTR